MQGSYIGNTTASQAVKAEGNRTDCSGTVRWPVPATSANTGGYHYFRRRRKCKSIPVPCSKKKDASMRRPFFACDCTINCVYGSSRVRSLDWQVKRMTCFSWASCFRISRAVARRVSSKRTKASSKIRGASGINSRATARRRAR